MPIWFWHVFNYFYDFIHTMHTNYTSVPNQISCVCVSNWIEYLCAKERGKKKKVSFIPKMYESVAKKSLKTVNFVALKIVHNFRCDVCCWAHYHICWWSLAIFHIRRLNFVMCCPLLSAACMSQGKYTKWIRLPYIYIKRYGIFQVQSSFADKTNRRMISKTRTTIFFWFVFIPDKILGNSVLKKKMFSFFSIG